MRHSVIAGTAALALVSSVTAAQDYDDLQAGNTSVLAQLVKALKTGDVSAISNLDHAIDYAPDNHSSSIISPERMVEMFKGCVSQSMTSAQRFSDTTILDFACPSRKAAGSCSTGELRVMVYRQPALSLRVIERQRIGPDCKMPAPPAISSSSGGLH